MTEIKSFTLKLDSGSAIAVTKRLHQLGASFAMLSPDHPLAEKGWEFLRHDYTEPIIPSEFLSPDQNFGIKLLLYITRDIGADNYGCVTSSEIINQIEKPPVTTYSDIAITRILKDKPKKERVEENDFLELIKSNGTGFFCDHRGIPFAKFQNGNHYEIHQIKSQTFRNFWIRKYYDSSGQLPNDNNVRQAVNYCHAYACFDGKTYLLEPRINSIDGIIYYDLCNTEWSAIKIDQNGWRLEQNPPTIFVRYRHQQPQVMPDGDGNAEDLNCLFNFINSQNSDEQLLVKVYLICGFLPSIPRPILILHGSAGSGKTLSMRLLRELIDPSALETISFPPEKKDLIVNFLLNYCIPFDNLRELKSWQSDILCRVVSGDSLMFRELYSDLDGITANFRRLLLMNGINIPCESPDMLDRAILLEMERIQRENRRTEEEILGEFERQKPRILGAIFNTLVKAMEIKKTLTLRELPRMADFCLWGEAVSQAMGEPPLRFYRIYLQNIGKHTEDIIYADPVGASLMQFIASDFTTDTWEGKPTELYARLKEIAEKELKINLKDSEFPKAPNSMSRKLNELKINLLEEGIEIMNTPKRTIKIIKREVKNTCNINISAEGHSNGSTASNNDDDISENIYREKENICNNADIKNICKISALSNKPEKAENGLTADMQIDTIFLGVDKEKQNSDGMVTVKINQSLPNILGLDGKEYQIQEGETITLPRRTAEILQGKGVVEILKNDLKG